MGEDEEMKNNDKNKERTIVDNIKNGIAQVN